MNRAWNNAAGVIVKKAVNLTFDYILDLILTMQSKSFCERKLTDINADEIGPSNASDIVIVPANPLQLYVH